MCSRTSRIWHISQIQVRHNQLRQTIGSACSCSNGHARPLKHSSSSLLDLGLPSSSLVDGSTFPDAPSGYLSWSRTALMISCDFPRSLADKAAIEALIDRYMSNPSTLLLAVMGLRSLGNKSRKDSLQPQAKQASKHHFLARGQKSRLDQNAHSAQLVERA